MAVKPKAKTYRQILAENEELRLLLEESQETLRAIRAGEVDAVVVSGTGGERIFTLQGADRSYRALIEEMNEGALNLTRDGMILYANQKFADMLHAPLDSLTGSSLQARVTPEGQALLEALLREGAHDKRHAEMMLLAMDGTAVPVYLSLTPMTVEGLSDCIGAVVMDLTERKHTEEALRVSEAKFRNLFQNASLGKLLVDLDGRVEANGAAVAILGYTGPELQASEWKQIVHPEDVPAVQNAFKGLNEGRLAAARFEMRLVHKKGSLVWADVTMSLVRDAAGSPAYVLVSAYDITARKDADAALLELKQHLERYIEAERLNLARDLHDVPLQELYGILYRLEEMRPKTHSQRAEVISEVIADVKGTLASLRSIATDLRPPADSKHGFEKTARTYIEEFRQKHPAMMVVASLKRDNRALPQDIRLMLFRVLQEAFSNIIRHAQATDIDVSFRFDSTEACLQITDNGKGFAVPEKWTDLVRGGHYGLAGMAERVSMAGGQLSVASTPGVSTTVSVRLPYSSPKETKATRKRPAAKPKEPVQVRTEAPRRRNQKVKS